MVTTDLMIDKVSPGISVISLSEMASAFADTGGVISITGSCCVVLPQATKIVVSVSIISVVIVFLHCDPLLIVYLRCFPLL